MNPLQSPVIIESEERFSALTMEEFEAQVISALQKLDFILDTESAKNFRQ